MYTSSLQLQITGKQQKGNQQSAIDGWPVAYHGTSIENAVGILIEGFQVYEGSYGWGIYATPNPETALTYAKEYKYNVRIIVYLRFQSQIMCYIARKFLIMKIVSDCINKNGRTDINQSSIYYLVNFLG